jgi:amino-acid N-acetyltransferase
MANIRKAMLSDIRPVMNLINSYAGNGTMLPRSEFEMAENIRDFMVAGVGNRIVGCGALHACDEIAMVKQLKPAEIPPLQLVPVGEITLLPVSYK